MNLMQAIQANDARRRFQERINAHKEIRRTMKSIREQQIKIAKLREINPELFPIFKQGERV